MPLALKETPLLSFERALALFQSENPDERQLGLTVLFRRYPNNTAAWDAFIQLLVTTPAESVPGNLIYYLAHIPWHGDIFYTGELITSDTREHVQRQFVTFRETEVTKLLGFIDPENMISRGSLGQSVDAIISAIPNSVFILQQIASDSSAPLFRRECAAFICAMRQGKESLEILEKLSASGSSYAQELIEYIRENGEINPYA